ncbi:hypothetical protein [Fusobacterium necrophorum]|uniref:hypothetical protein n=1 Tax=Fusobacterium necrophorum TaxID=859 RepID=UPI00164D72B9|nr:hypothetical protein [Fusobacterium necrophorum]
MVLRKHFSSTPFIIQPSMRLDATLLKKLQKVAPEKKFVEKIEEGILLFLEKYEK